MDVNRLFRKRQRIVLKGMKWITDCCKPLTSNSSVKIALFNPPYCFYAQPIPAIILVSSLASIFSPNIPSKLASSSTVLPGRPAIISRALCLIKIRTCARPRISQAPKRRISLSLMSVSNLMLMSIKFASSNSRPVQTQSRNRGQDSFRYLCRNLLYGCQANGMLTVCTVVKARRC